MFKWIKPAEGQRKFLMCMAYLGCCTVLDFKAMDASMDWAGLASLNASLATGLGVIVWGNVKSHQSSNGK